MQGQIDELIRRERTEIQAPGIKQVQEQQKGTSVLNREDREWGKQSVITETTPAHVLSYVFPVNELSTMGMIIIPLYR